MIQQCLSCLKPIQQWPSLLPPDFFCQCGRDSAVAFTVWFTSTENNAAIGAAIGWGEITSTEDTMSAMKRYMEKYPSCMSRLCYECGKPLDMINESYRIMDVYHEKGNPHTMQISAHERCIIGSPNERNWQYSTRFEVTVKEKVEP